MFIEQDVTSAETSRAGAGRGDADAQFTAELHGFIPLLRNYARQFCRDEEAASDLAQETLTKAWQARRTFRQGTNLKAWLVTIMRNQFRSDARRNWRQVAWDEDAAQRIPGPPHEQLHTVELSDAARALSALPRGQREALLLIGVGGFSGEDAAALCHCRPTAVKSRMSRARQALLSMLRGEEPLPHQRPARGAAAEAIIAQLERLTGRSAFTH
jgi:RNA polymerase sigma-70 factor, ECF subfamily